MLDYLRATLESDSGVLGLLVFGSVAGSGADAWSDLVLLVVVEESAEERFYPSLDWLSGIGTIYATEQHADAGTSVSRVCFEDMNRLDIVLATEPALQRIDDWPSVPFAAANTRKVIFSRSAVLDSILAKLKAESLPRLPSKEDFARMSNAFWFRGVMAITKVVRDDRLIAFHLALEMLQDCLVLGMLLRDRATGTSFHRTGGSWSSLVDEVKLSRVAPTREGILDLIERCAVTFDGLAAEWDPGYREMRWPLLALAESALRPKPPS